MNFRQIVLAPCFVLLGCSNPTDDAISTMLTKVCTLTYSPSMQKGCRCISKEVLQGLTQREKDNFEQASEGKKRAFARTWFEQGITPEMKIVCLTQL